MAEKVKKEKVPIPRKVEVAFVAMIVIFVLLVGGLTWAVIDIQNLGKENKTRINDIQNSRLESCKQTYAGIHKVFVPFFPPKPRTQKQQNDLDKFNLTIDTLTKGCEKQVRSSDGG